MDKILKVLIGLTLVQLVEVEGFLPETGGPMPLWIVIVIFIPFALCACVGFILTCCADCIDIFNEFRSRKEEPIVE